jgi:hypothetical protein
MLPASFSERFRRLGRRSQVLSAWAPSGEDNGDRNPVNHGEIVSFIWGVADLIRDTFKRGKYQDVILPLAVLRRLDCVLAPTKAKVLISPENSRMI